MKDKILTLFTIALFAGGLGTIVWVLYNSFLLKKQLNEVGEVGCVHQRLQKTMENEFMADVLPKGHSFEVLLGYYKCNPVQRGDLVYFRHSTPREPVVRKIYGLPGDHFAVNDTETANVYSLTINEKPIEISQGPLQFKSMQVPPLKTFEIARQGVLGTNEFIVLGEATSSPYDSVSLGVVKLTNFEGKAVP